METPLIPLPVNVIVTEYNGKPAIFLRRFTNNRDLIKLVVSSAFHERPIIIQPTFTNKWNSINTLVEKGVLVREGEDFVYTL
jgi:hypothetical protein